jgi:hypothetical protein
VSSLALLSLFSFTHPLLLFSSALRFLTYCILRFGVASLWVMFAVFAVCLVASVAGALYGQVKRGNEDEGIVARG